MGTSTGVDVLLLAVVLALAAVVLLGAWLESALRPPLPVLPAVDAAPDGLGRLLPVGRQVDLEARSGLVALDSWLRCVRARP